MQLSIFSSEELPASPFQSQDSERDWLIRVATSRLRSLPLLTAIAPAGWSGRTSPASFPQIPTTVPIHVRRRHQWAWDATAQRWKLKTTTTVTKVTRSPACWPDFQNSGISAPTGLLTLNTPVWRSGGSACSLSSILESGNVPRRFFIQRVIGGRLARRVAADG